MSMSQSLAGVCLEGVVSSRTYCSYYWLGLTAVLFMFFEHGQAFVLVGPATRGPDPSTYPLPFGSDESLSPTSFGKPCSGGDFLDCYYLSTGRKRVLAAVSTTTTSGGMVNETSVVTAAAATATSSLDTAQRRDKTPPRESQDKTVPPSYMSSSSPSSSSPYRLRKKHHSTYASRGASGGSRSYYGDCKDIFRLNEALNQLAEEAGDGRNSVIRKAMAAEQLWKEFHVVVSSDADNKNNKATSAGPRTSSLLPDTVSFNTVLKAWSKATQVLAEHHHDRNHDHLLDPNIPIYTARECAMHALELLNQQEHDAYESRLLLSDNSDDDKTTQEAFPQVVSSPDLQSFNTLLDTWAKSQTDEEAILQVEDLLRRLRKSDTLEPDAISYNSLLDAYGYSQRPDRLDKMRRIWKFMEESPSLYLKMATPRTVSSILRAYSLLLKENHGDKHEATELAQEAQEKFDMLKRRFEETRSAEHQPDVIVYTNMMDVWSKVGTMESAQKAEDLFQDLKTNGRGSRNVNLRPSSYSYSTVITAWSRVAWFPSPSNRASERVIEILDEMVHDDQLLSLSHHPFTAALKCWARGAGRASGRKESAAVLALNTLKQMKELSKTDRRVRPNLATYHAALDCCGRSGKEDTATTTPPTVALKIAFAILQSLQKDGIKATNLTYVKLLQCVTQLLPLGAERNTVAKATFEKARSSGVADDTVVRAFKRAADVSVLVQTVGEICDHSGYVDYTRIPNSWKKNV